MKKLILLILLFNNLSYGQKDREIVLKSIDSQEFAIKNILKVKDKKFCIKILLEYQDNFEINKNWYLNKSLIMDKAERRSRGIPVHLSNQMIAMYLIEIIIRNTTNVAESIYLLEKNLRTRAGYSLLIIHGANPNHVSEKKLKKIFSYYSKWLKKFERSKLNLSDYVKVKGTPLSKTVYGWNMSDMNKIWPKDNVTKEQFFGKYAY